MSYPATSCIDFVSFNRHLEVHFSRMRIALPRDIVLEQHGNDLPIHFWVNRGTPNLVMALDFFQFSFFRSFLAWYAVVMSEGDTGCTTVP